MATTRIPSTEALKRQVLRHPLALGSKIEGVGSAIPGMVRTNADLEKIVDTTDEWIVARTGIKQRYIAPPDVQNSDLVAEAALKAIENAGLTPEEIDCAIVGTATPDTVFPSTACWAQPKIGLRRGVPVFDVSAACSGWLYGSILADSMIRSGTAKHVVVIGSEVLSRSVNWEDRSTCVLFGDGAGATVMGPSRGEGEGFLAHTWGADGNLAHLLWQPAGGTRLQASHETVDAHQHAVHMQGNEVYKHAVRAMQQAVSDVIEVAGVSGDEIDLFIPHQANVRIMQAAAERAGLSMDKVYVAIHKYGNVSAASIPMALADAQREGRLHPGDLVLTAAFGAGFTWGAALIRI